MASTYSKYLLSGSVDGKAIPVITSGSYSGGSGTLIHTAGASGMDEVWIYAVNSGTADALLTLEWGELSSVGRGQIPITIPADLGLTLVVPGLIIQNSLSISAFTNGSSGSSVQIHGYVNRIT
jgi:hypothetical protein